MNTRVCTECGCTFQVSGYNRRCPCQLYDLCACGARKWKRSKTCAACHTEKGASNNNWKGGQTRHKKGYLMSRTPGHPRAVTGNYVFEHILVMERLLGRYLLPDETVHHRNGVRDDNRPENLELWTAPQPAGIRASDAVAWAREILARYEGKFDVLGIIRDGDEPCR
jgi:HNH endonuclease